MDNQKDGTTAAVGKNNVNENVRVKTRIAKNNDILQSVTPIPERECRDRDKVKRHVETGGAKLMGGGA